MPNGSTAQESHTVLMVLLMAFNGNEKQWQLAENHALHGANGEDDEVFCTLVFNANGQLCSIAFAPSRNGRPAARAAEQSAAGFRFTVTGLSQKTHYAFEMKVKDKADQLLQTYTGEFDTKADTPSAADNVSSEQESVRKVVRDGQVLIIRGDKTYTATGIEVK